MELEGHHRAFVYLPPSPLPLLQDLENTIGSWDMYGMDEKKRYNGLQSEFFERAASGLTRREYLTGLIALGGGAILAWGLKGSKAAKLPITVGPQKASEPGPRGRL
jgi:photosystem I subunit VI